jgi:hypothetical protein
MAGDNAVKIERDRKEGWTWAALRSIRSPQPAFAACSGALGEELVFNSTKTSFVYALGWGLRKT